MAIRRLQHTGRDLHRLTVAVDDFRCGSDWGSRGPGFKSRQPDHARLTPSGGPLFMTMHNAFAGARTRRSKGVSVGLLRFVEEPSSYPMVTARTPSSGSVPS